MSADEINAAIAESLGVVSRNQHGKLYHTEQGYVVDCPNYHGSLDAIVPVVRAMPAAETSEVIDTLISMNLKRSCTDDFLATPTEWCEAYLKAKGLWK